MIRASLAALFCVGVLISSVAAHGGGGGGGHGGHGGFVPSGFPGGHGFPLFGLGDGYGGYMPLDYYGGYAPYDSYGSFGSDVPTIRPPRQDVNPSLFITERPATLRLELPAAGQVWVNGGKSEGKPNNQWTLTSPNLKCGQEFIFDLTAHWVVDGKTYEYKSTVSVPSGNRSRLNVLSGTLIEK